MEPALPKTERHGRATKIFSTTLHLSLTEGFKPLGHTHDLVPVLDNIVHQNKIVETANIPKAVTKAVGSC